MTKSVVEALILLCEGGRVPSGKIPSQIAARLLEDGVLTSVSHGSRVVFKGLPGLREHLSALDERLSNPEGYLALLEGAAVSRAEQVALTGNSKAVASRSCPGFPVNSYEPVRARLAGAPLTVFPQEGTFLFVSDWENFQIPEDVLVVGVENMENFRRPRSQRYLFEGFGLPVLFVSRYPQSGDLVRWLSGIPNRYLHFGDLDLAGVNIFLTEFYARLGARSSFFVPSDAAMRLSQGSRSRYDDQYERFRDMLVPDPRVRPLVDLINTVRRGYDQEGFLRR